MTTEKVTLFIDAQSLYNAIRDAFFSDTDNHVCGQVDPMKLANFICSQPPPGVTRVLNEVRVYSGRPDPTRDPRTHAAHMKQCAEWSRGGVHLITRQLRYPREWPNHRAQEKGIDVTLAIDFVSFAVDCLHDVGVLASFDTDLIPAMEFVLKRPTMKCRVEVVGLNSSKTPRRRLRVPGYSLYCYWIDAGIYGTIADTTDYNL
jgi:uncharacterized LabA/DUF88 family protein